VQIHAVKALLCLGCKWLSFCTCHIYCVVWGKFDISTFFLLNVCEFHENWHRESVAVLLFLRTSVKLHLCVCLQARMIFLKQRMPS
jgi:hypothetical protein